MRDLPLCFISYCHEDTDETSIAPLVGELKALAETDVVILALPNIADIIGAVRGMPQILAAGQRVACIPQFSGT